MYSIIGVSLNDSGLGWGILSSSKPFAEVLKRSVTLSMPGRDGVVPLPLASSFGPSTMLLVVVTPKEKLEDLLSLLSQPVLELVATADPTRSVDVELLSAPYDYYGPEARYVAVKALLRLNGAFWRDAAESTSLAVALGSASVDVDVFLGLSAPVGDALVRVGGAATGLRVEDAGGSWFTYDSSIPSGSYLRFHSDTGEAFVTTSDVWTGGTDVSGLVDFGGPRGVFEITPAFTDPAVRSGRLTVTTATRSGAQVQVRGKAAYLV